MKLLTKVWKLNISSNPPVSFTFIKKDMPNMANINMTKKRSRPMFTRAGKDTASENNNVRIPECLKKYM